MNTESMAKKLVELRGEMSQRVAAEKIGISVSALAMYETGKRIPRDKVKIMIAKAYKTSVQKIFFAD